LQQNKPQEHPK